MVYRLIQRILKSQVLPMILFFSLLSLGYAWVEAPSVCAEEPSRPFTSYQQGVQAYQQADYAKAIEQLQQAAAKDPNNPLVHYYLALSLEQLELLEQASQAYQTVLSLQPEPQLREFAAQKVEKLSALQQQAVQNTLSMNQLPINKAPVWIPLPHEPSAEVSSNSEDVLYQLAAHSVSVPLKNNVNALMVDAAIQHFNQSAKGVFIIDTGATYTSISRAMAERLGLDLSHCETVLITTANGRIEVPKVTLQSLTVNGLKAHHVEATVIPVHQDASFSGLLGLSFIRQFMLTIDPQGGRLIFQKQL